MPDLQLRPLQDGLSGRFFKFLGDSSGTWGAGAYGISYATTVGTKGLQLEGQATALLMTVKGAYVFSADPNLEPDHWSLKFGVGNVAGLGGVLGFKAFLGAGPSDQYPLEGNASISANIVVPFVSYIPHIGPILGAERNVSLSHSWSLTDRTAPAEQEIDFYLPDGVYAGRIQNPLWNPNAPTTFSDRFSPFDPSLADRFSASDPSFNDRFSAIYASSAVPYLDLTGTAQYLRSQVPASDFPAFPSWAKPDGAQPNFDDRFPAAELDFNDRYSNVPTDPLAANGVMSGFSFLNGMLLNTQSGQIAFGSLNGLSNTSADWPTNFGNNNVGSLDFNGLNQTAAMSWYSPYIPQSNDYSFNPGFSYDAFNYLGNPIVLDLTGAGINITELGSSGQYVDMTGSGYQNRTAWAGAGNGVLVFDVNGNGSVDSPKEIQFTEWDPTATSDMQALRDVFDTNHNGKLDAGDTNFAAFKVMVTNADGTTTLRTLAELGIVSINLTTDNNRTVLADGSVIAGQTTFTRADGSTGTAADVSLAYDGNGYATQQTVTHNADGSTTIDVKAINPDGSLAGETVSTTSADGLSRVVKFDHSGNGILL